MKKNIKILVIVSVLIMVAIWGFLAYGNETPLFKGLDLIILMLTIILGIVALSRALKKSSEKKAGLITEDELSTFIKYKSGYEAYMASMYMWLVIFLFKDKFPDIETMLGGGILLSALIGYISKIVVKRKLND